MPYIFSAPSRYIQGRHILADLDKYLSDFGKKALIIGSDLGLTILKNSVKPSGACALIYASFGGECSMTEIHKMEDVSHANGCDLIVGAGGGKALDTAKATAHFLHLPCVIIPTAVSSDAPTSALAVIYHDDGSLDRRLPLAKNPDLILIDSQVIANAPARLLAAGMGDAFSTYFEARACAASDSDNIHAGKSTLTAQVIARACYDTLIRDGKKALEAVQHHLCTRAVENIIEANTLMSGIGFESGGKGAAHPIGDGLNTVAQCKGMHGEKVAFGSLVQLFLENADESELDEAYRFCASVGLPVTLADLSITEDVDAAVRQIAHTATLPDKPIYNLPFTITEELVVDCIWAADLYGQKYKTALS